MLHAKLTALELARLEACSTEPIRTPGSIQPHGIFLAAERESRRIVVVSENVEAFLGVRPSDALGRLVDDFVDPERFDALRAAALGANPVDVNIRGQLFDAIVHREGPVTFVELEPQLPSNDREHASSAYAATHRISLIRDRQALFEQTAIEFSELVGFDRTMVYHFHPDGHGEIVAEVHAEGMEPYLGLHFPASDIPPQARDLYLTKLSRAIVTTQTPNVPLVGLDTIGGEKLNLSQAELRSVSPFHLQFMRNMGQASTVSFSLVYEDELIGMITCAHNSERRIPFLMRRRLEALATQIGLQLGALRRIEDLSTVISSHELRAELLSKIVASDDISGALLDGDFTLLDVITSDSAIVCLDGITSATASAPDTADSRALMRDLSHSDSELVSDALRVTHPEIASRLPGIAGLLFVPFGRDGDFLAFFRNEVTQSIDWLGDLNEQNRAEVLSPRLSFSAWRESVTGRSLPWEDLPASAVDLARDIENALLRRRESRLATLALRDPLTGLGNRRYLLEELGARAALVQNISMLFIDLDAFKEINDTFGHDAGDTVIVTVGERLSEQTRSEDLVVRLGGDEFVVIGFDLGEVDAQAMASRIVAALREPIALDEGNGRVTASIGVVTVPSTTTAAEMLERADEAMYRAKLKGKNQVAS